MTESEKVRILREALIREVMRPAADRQFCTLCRREVTGVAAVAEFVHAPSCALAATAEPAKVEPRICGVWSMALAAGCELVHGHEGLHVSCGDAFAGPPSTRHGFVAEPARSGETWAIRSEDRR